MIHAVDPIAAVEQARRQHELLYVDVIVLHREHVVDGGRYSPRTPVAVPYATTRALVQVDRTIAAAAQPGVDDVRISGVIVKCPLDVSVSPGDWAKVEVCDHTPSLVGRWFRVTDDDLQSLAVTLRFRALLSEPANVRPAEAGQP